MLTDNEKLFFLKKNQMKILKLENKISEKKLWQA